MTTQSETTNASRDYAAAYAAHYAKRDLPMALQLYTKLLQSHPDAVEAKYSRTQLLNIINSVVPIETLLKAQLELVVAEFERDRPFDVNALQTDKPRAT